MRSKLVSVTLLGIKAYLGFLMLPFMLISLLSGSGMGRGINLSPPTI